jgi:6-phosphofructokinase 2
LKEGVEMIKSNMRELAGIVGRDIEDDGDLERVAEGLVVDGKARVVIVSMGAGGAIVSSDRGNHHIRAPTVPVRSKVGAGDSTVGGLVTALDRGDELLDAARFAVAAGAAAVMTPGTELCHRVDVERIAGGLARD